MKIDKKDSQPVVKVIVATHKKYRMPEDGMYVPVHVGAEINKNTDGSDINLEYVKDNNGVNISEKNPYFCELTGLYYAWKNLNADYIGLVHYRRYFAGKEKGKDCFDYILKNEELIPMLKSYKIIVPHKRRYYIETLYTHYAHTHYAIHLDLTRKIISDRKPEYLKSFEKVLNKTFGYMFNMMIMEKKLLDNYCSWVFDILFELEIQLGKPNMTTFQNRYYGRVSEIIFNVWLDYQISNNFLNKKQIKELPCIYMEKINWKIKYRTFLKAKFLHIKYNGSF